MQTIKEQVFDLQQALEQFNDSELDDCENRAENYEAADLGQKYEDAFRKIEEVINYLSDSLAIRTI